MPIVCNNIFRNMFSSTVHYSVGTRCLLLMTRLRQHTYKSSKGCVSFALKAPLPIHDQPRCHYTRGDAQVSAHKKILPDIASFQRFSHGATRSYPSIFLLPSSSYSTDGSKLPDETPPKKLSLFQKFKQMYRDYWYVLVPVHLITSLGWFGGFYYLAVSGVDIVAMLEYWGVSDKLINPLRDSHAGYIAVAYALYKIATPVRYTVTLGGTTISIKYLKEWGYIKPMPAAGKLKEMYQERKELYQEELKLKQEKLKKTKDDMMRGYRGRANSKPNK